jgi:hypothetical protein
MALWISKPLPPMPPMPPILAAPPVPPLPDIIADAPTIKDKTELSGIVASTSKA